jgi:hypothetical protein
MQPVQQIIDAFLASHPSTEYLQSIVIANAELEQSASDCFEAFRKEFLEFGRGFAKELEAVVGPAGVDETIPAVRWPFKNNRGVCVSLRRNGIQVIFEFACRNPYACVCENLSRFDEYNGMPTTRQLERMKGLFALRAGTILVESVISKLGDMPTG